MDLRQRGSDGVEATRCIVACCPHSSVLILTSYGGDEAIHRALEAGARGYLMKDAPPGALGEALMAVSAGRRYIPPDVAMRLAGAWPRVTLTEREETVLRLMADGLRNKEIARAARITEATARTHVQNILGKFDCGDRDRAIARGSLTLDERR